MTAESCPTLIERRYRNGSCVTASSQDRIVPSRHLHPAELAPADVLDQATSEIGVGTKLGFDATRKLPGEGFKRPWPPLIQMDGVVKARAEQLWKTMH